MAFILGNPAPLSTPPGICGSNSAHNSITDIVSPLFVSRLCATSLPWRRHFYHASPANAIKRLLFSLSLAMPACLGIVYIYHSVLYCRQSIYGKECRPVQLSDFQWTRKPKAYTISSDKIEIITQPHTDLWQRTYYHFRNDSAPVLQMRTEQKFFSFVVKTDFNSQRRFDQCGVVVYLDSENWLKASVEYENERFQHLGSVVTNYGYSDWATTQINAGIHSMWYRLSRRENDFRVECSSDGVAVRTNAHLSSVEGNGRNPLRYLCLQS